MIIAQLSDPHIAAPNTEFDALYKTSEKLKTAIKSINRLKNKPDLIMITGDLVNCGEEAEYKILKSILKELDIPCYLGIGNHDCRETFQAVFSDQGYLPENGFVHYSIEQENLRLIMLDTNIFQAPQGVLCPERLAWLDKTLSEKPDMPTLLFMHHPPFKTGIKTMDNMGLEEAKAFGQVVEKHDQVIRIFCGHLHRPIQSVFHGTPVQVCPSTSHRVMLCLEGDETLATTSEPPEILLHVWDGNNLVTHSMPTADYEILWKLEGELY